jgi:hypothetical protein
MSEREQNENSIPKVDRITSLIQAIPRKADKDSGLYQREN